MALGFFAGASAEATNESLREWKSLFQREKLAEQQYEIQRQQMSQTARLQRDQQEFQERLARLQQSWADGNLDRQEALAVGRAALDQLPGMTVDQQMALANTFKETGNPFAPIVSNSVRTGFFDDPMQAFGLVNSVFTADLGTQFTDEFVYMALDTVAGRAGWDEETRQRVRSQVDEALVMRREDAERFKEMQWSEAETALAQGEADLNQTLAETEEIDARTAAIFQDTEFKAAEHEYVLDHMDLTNQLLTTEVAIGEINAEQLPEQIRASLAEVWSRVQNNEDQHTLFTRTVDATVRQMVAQADIDEETARHMVATGMYQDAIVRYQADSAELGVQELEAAIAVAWAQEGLIGAQTDLLGLEMTEGVVSIASSLVEGGHADLLQQVAPELFANLPEEAREELVSSLTETANSNLSTRRKLEDANMRIAIADAEWAETRPERDERDADLRQDQFELDKWYKEQGISLSEEELALRRRELDQRREAAQSATGVDPLAMEALKYAEDATGMDVDDLNGYIEDAQRIGRDIASLTDGVGLTGNEQQDIATLTAGLQNMGEQGILRLAENYGFSVDAISADPQAFIESLPQVILQDRQAAEARVEQRIGAFMRAYELSAGRPPTASEIGMDENDPLYRQAVNRTRGVDPLGDVGDELDEVGTSARDMVIQLLPRIGVEGFTLGGAQAMWDSLVEQHGEEEVKQAFGSPSAMMENIDPFIKEFRPVILSAQDTLDQVGQFMPEEMSNLDILSGEDRGQALNWLEAAGTQVDQFFNTYEEITSTANRVREATGIDGAIRGLFGGDRDVEVEQDLVGQLIDLGMDRQILVQNGIIDSSHRILNPAGFRQVLVTMRDAIGTSYNDLLEVDRLIRY